MSEEVFPVHVRVLTCAGRATIVRVGARPLRWGNPHDADPHAAQALHHVRLVGVPFDRHGLCGHTSTAATGAVPVPHRKGSRTMDWSDSPEQAVFRKEVRDFIQSELPERYRGGEEGSAIRR